MITFKNNINCLPFIKFKEVYNEALVANQKIIEAVCVSSYSKSDQEVDSRFVNLKIVDADSFIFFSNYNSPKSIQFQSHSQVSLVFHWSSINTQIRMKGHIKKSLPEVSDNYFSLRSDSKNALAIASSQSDRIDSYEYFVDIYEQILKQSDLSKRPDYWGGFSFVPYYFEFWKGHESRLNRRDAYQLKNDKWIHSVLQP